MPKSPSSLLARLRAGVAPRYTVERHVAAGGMGHVFKGFDTKLDRDVAFKVLAPELATATMAERFRREAERLAALNSVPNIVQVYDADETPDKLLYFIMQFVDGPTLAQVLKEVGTLPVQRVRSLAVHLLTAVKGAHELGITHRDIKPANIFLRGEQALLGDFGIASASDSTETTLTEEGVRIGTPLYMSPEQHVAESVGPLSDQYSLALVLWECLTGRVPTQEERQARQSSKGLPKSVKHVLQRALAKDPSARWPEAAAFREALEDAIPLKRRRRFSTAVSALLVAVASMTVVVLIVFGDSIAAWARARVCSVAHLSFCDDQLRRYDLALPPFALSGGGDIGYELANQVARHLDGTTRIGLAPVAQTAEWWDSLPTRKRGTPPRGVAYYTAGTVTQSAGVLSAALELRDSTGQTFERFETRADTSKVDSLAYALADSIVCRGPFRADCADFQVFGFRPTSKRVRAEFFAGKDAAQRGYWAEAEEHFKEALDRDSTFMPAAWELMIAKRIQRKNFSADLQYISRNIDALPPYYRRLAIASLTPDLRERFRLFEDEVRRSKSGTAWLLYTNELFHRGALVGRPLQETVDLLTHLAATEPGMNHSSTYDMAWWGEVRLGRPSRAWQDLERRQALGPPPGDTYRPFQRLGTWSRFSPWKADIARWLLLRSPSDSVLSSLTDFARLGSLMDIPAEQLALGDILVAKGVEGRQRAAGLIGRAGAHLMLGQPDAAMVQLDSAADVAESGEMRLQQREWPVHLAALGLYFDTARVSSARAWLDSAPLTGNERVRALYALGQDALARGDTLRSGELLQQLQALSPESPTAERHSTLLRAGILGRHDPRAALDLSSVIYIRDTTLVHLSPFARATTYLERGAWQKALRNYDAADAAWLWYESSDFEGWPSGQPQEGELDAILSVYARMLRGELRAQRSDRALACRHLDRVRELWVHVEPAMLNLRQRADSAAKTARCH